MRSPQAHRSEEVRRSLCVTVLVLVSACGPAEPPASTTSDSPVPHAVDSVSVEAHEAVDAAPPPQHGSLWPWDGGLTSAEFAQRYFVWPSEEPGHGDALRWDQAALAEAEALHLAWWHRRSSVPPEHGCAESYSQAPILVVGSHSTAGCLQTGVDVNGWFFRNPVHALEYLLQLTRWSELRRYDQARVLNRWMPRILFGFEDWEIVRSVEWLESGAAEVIMESAQATHSSGGGSGEWGRYRRETWRVNVSGHAERVDEWEAPCNSSALCGRDLWREHLLESVPVFVDGAVEIRGPIEPGVVSRVFRENRRNLRSCYERGLREDPTLPAADFLIWIMLTESGDMSSARVIPADVGDEDLRDCVLGRVRRFRLPLNASGPAQIAYPVSLWTEDGRRATARVGSWREGREVETE